MKNLINQRFGKLLVIKQNSSNKHRSIQWLCKCDCGKVKSITSPSLINGNTKSCGCLRYIKGIRIKNMINQKFGRWTVIRQDGFDKSGQAKWFCRCICGKERSVVGHSLRKGISKSCGCLAKEITKKNNSTHGLSGKRFYNIYRSMRARCENPKSKNFDRYGKKGIKCLWKIFEDFRNDMHKSYSEHIKNFGEKDTTIERIDNSGNYSKENCKWATNKEQQRNRGNNRFITYKGETHLRSEWEEILGI